MGSIASASTSFNGSSTYAAQLQQVITNAVNQASAPIQQLQSQQSTLEGQQVELETLSSDFQTFQSTLDAINSAGGAGGYSANVSDTSVATASLSSGVMAGNYSINISNIGSQTSTLSANGLPTVTDPSSGNIDSSSTYTLTVNGQQYSISNSAGTLDGLVQAINASGADVQATAVNVGSSASPDYRLSVQSTNYAPDAIQLSDGTNSGLLNTLNTGTYVTYQVNGAPSVNSTSRNVTVSPGLTLNLMQAGSATIRVAQNVTSLSNALSSFVATYNAVSGELQNNRGQNGGALSGQSIVYNLQGALENLTSYTGGSSDVTSLADLGITFDDNGNLQFNSSTFDALATTSPSQIVNFLGSETGGGFLQAAQNIVTSVNDSTTGMLAESSQAISSEISTIESKISDDQSSVSQLQQSLTAQMASADSTIAALQTQVTEITTLFTDMQEEYKAANG